MGPQCANSATLFQQPARCAHRPGYLDLGGTVVELISYEGVTVDPAPQTEHLGYRMMALEVDDMQKTADYLRTKGVEIVWGPRVRETYSRAEICDPNGYHIELRQWFR
jgi:catechol 2,3-dioxygenase-like lactoylglutathione lyase family enzyme